LGFEVLNHAVGVILLGPCAWAVWCVRCFLLRSGCRWELHSGDGVSMSFSSVNVCFNKCS